MKSKLKILISEFDIAWEDPHKNHGFLDELLKGYEADLILMPEMFTTGFSMNPNEIAEPAFSDTFRWMKALAKKKKCAVAGTVSTRENEKFLNRFYFVTPDKEWHYDKKHLFGYGKETEAYTAGNEIVTAEFEGWKFRLIVCYDLRFPAWCRNTDDYDVLLCPANWPAVRNEQWLALLKARAIENMAYVIGVNRLGTDGYKLLYEGNSRAFDAIGTELQLNRVNKHLLQTELLYEATKNHRENYGFLNDQDSFQFR